MKRFTIQQHVRSVTEILCIHIMILNDIKASNQTSPYFNLWAG